jgi:hypothetical protein
MALRTKEIKRLDVPNEPGQWVDIQAVSFLTLDKAKSERLKVIGDLSAAFVQLQKAIASNGTAAALAEARAAADEDRLQQYDKFTLLKHGLIAWSYGGPVTPEDLDGPTAEWAARAILDHTLPTEAETKTPSSLSTGR